MTVLYKYSVTCADCECLRYTDYRVDEPSVCPYNQEHTDISDVTVVAQQGEEVSIYGMQDDNHALRMALSGNVGKDFTVYSHDFCDPTTWYTEAIEVIEETLSHLGSNVYDSDNENWIDLFRGRVSDEVKIREDYPITVTDDGVELDREDPFSEEGGDYSVDPENGRVTLKQDATGAVKATYHRADGSNWIFVPPNGTIYNIIKGKASIKISDWVMNTSFYYEVLIDAGPTVVGSSQYDTAYQLFDTAEGCVGQVDGPLGGDEGRGFTGDMSGMRLEYTTTRRLDRTAAMVAAGYGTFLRIRLGNGDAFGGTRFTIKLTGEVTEE